MPRGRPRSIDPEPTIVPTTQDVLRLAMIFETRGRRIVQNYEPQLVFNSLNGGEELAWIRERFGGRIVSAGNIFRAVLRGSQLVNALDKILPEIAFETPRSRAQKLRDETALYLGLRETTVPATQEETKPRAFRPEDGEDVLSLPDPFDAEFLELLPVLLEARSRVVVQFRRKGSAEPYEEKASAFNLTAEIHEPFIVFTKTAAQQDTNDVPLISSEKA